MLVFKCSPTSVGFGVMENLTWYQSVYEEPLSVLIKIWNQCFRNFERVSISGVSMLLCTMEAIPLHSEHRFHWEIVSVSLKTVSV